MKNLNQFLGIVLLVMIVFTSCSKDNNDVEEQVVRSTPEAFSNIRAEALAGITQTFQFNADDGVASFTSENGVNITINGSCLTLNGNAVSGQVDLEFVEIFNKGTMLTTNKPTMGVLPNGDKLLLISGGEFLVEVTQNNMPIQTNCGFQLTIPADLTGGADNDMTLWTGVDDDCDGDDCDLAWVENNKENTTGDEGIAIQGSQYYAFVNNFGWTNVDRFYNDPRPKTTIQVKAPEGYNQTNSGVYLSYDGEDSGLAKLDIYDEDLNVFSEHYGQIPIGLECHVIFVTEEDANWKYAIKAVTIAENGIITITDDETAIVSEGGLVTLINDLP